MTIAAAQEAAKGSNIHIGAENVHFAEKGAYTGEVSAKMLTACGVEYVIIGHSGAPSVFRRDRRDRESERRRRRLRQGLKVILCLGEVLDQRQNGITDEIVSDADEAGSRRMSRAEDLKRVIIAYEPVWAIGTGLDGNARAGRRGLRHDPLRRWQSCTAAEVSGRTVTIQYGGSMNEKNAAELLSKGRTLTVV